MKKIIIKFAPLRIILWIYTFISIYPLFYMISYSLKNNDEIFYLNPFGFPTSFRIENYTYAFSRFNVPRYFFNSTFVTAMTIISAVAISLLFAYAVARMRWEMRNAARIYMTIGLFVPIQAFIIPLVVLMRNMHMLNSYLTLIIPYTAFNLSLSSMIFYSFFQTVPIEMEEAACIDGASIYRTFFAIIVPLIKPAIVTVTILLFLGVWNEFTYALVVTSKDFLKTLPLGVLNFEGAHETNWGAMGATMTIASLPAILVYLFFSESVEKAMCINAGIKG